jgi:hypothetical protein
MQKKKKNTESTNRIYKEDEQITKSASD